MTPERRDFHHKAANELASSNTSNTLCFDYVELEAELSRVEAERDALLRIVDERLGPWLNEIVAEYLRDPNVFNKGEYLRRWQKGFMEQVRARVGQQVEGSGIVGGEAHK